MWKLKGCLVLYCLFVIVGILMCVALADFKTRQYYEREIEENIEVMNKLTGGDSGGDLRR